MTEDLGQLDPQHAKRIAATCNNEAWDILELDNPDLGQIARLVACAATAQFHWHLVGTENNKAYADLLMAWALARAGVGAVALPLARETLSHFERSSSADWEMGFAHAAVAAASMAQNDREGFERHYSRADSIGQNLTGPEASHFHAAFRTLSTAMAK